MATSARHAHDVAPCRDRSNQALPTSTLLPAGFLALLQPLWRPLADYHTTSDSNLTGGEDAPLRQGETKR